MQLKPLTGSLLRYVVAAALAVFIPVAAHAFELTDERGVTTKFAVPPARIVSVLPSLTETVCALGECARLVGVDRYSNWPESVRALPRVGGGIDPNIEAIVKLRPDVVLIAKSAAGAARLEALGLKVVALEPANHADMRRVLRAVGDLLGVPHDTGADRVWRETEAGVTAAAASLPLRAKNARVYIEVSSGPYAASEASFIGETLARLGARNIVPASLGVFPKLNPEFVVRANPDVIMVGNRTMQTGFDYPGWSAIRAVREKRVCIFSNEEADIVVRPGPRMAEAARVMARCLSERAP